MHIHRHNCHPSIWQIWLLALGLEEVPHPIDCLTVTAVLPTLLP